MDIVSRILNQFSKLRINLISALWELVLLEYILFYKTFMNQKFRFYFPDEYSVSCSQGGKGWEK